MWSLLHSKQVLFTDTKYLTKWADYHCQTDFMALTEIRFLLQVLMTKALQAQLKK